MRIMSALFLCQLHHIFEMSKDMIPNGKHSSKQIRPVTFSHQRTLQNKKEQELNASMTSNYQNVEANEICLTREIISCLN